MGKAETNIKLEGRIDSSNAPLWEERLLNAVNDIPGDEDVVLDASSLQYISSAGLRVLLKLKKGRSSKITVKEVSPEVYDIFSTTGFDELLDVKKKMREISVEGCECIGEGFYGKVYRIDADTIVKVYATEDAIPMIENEKKMAKLAFLKGIPTAISYDIVKVGDGYGSVFELLNAKNLNDVIIEKEADPEEIEATVKQYVDFMKSIHEIELDPGSVPDAKNVFLNYLEALKDTLGNELYESLKNLIEKMPGDHHVVHGDIQMKNIMITDDELMLIDMDTLSAGDPVFEMAGPYATYQIFPEDEPENTMRFLGIKGDTAKLIWDKIFEYYFEDKKADPEIIMDKIRVAAYIRFLFIIIVSDLKNGELGSLRIRHSKEHLSELVKKVASLNTRE